MIEEYQLSQEFHQIIFNAVESNSKKDLKRLAEWIIKSESYNFPVEDSIQRKMISYFVYEAATNASEDDIKEVKKYIVSESVDPYIDYLRKEYGILKKVIGEIHEINQSYVSRDITDPELSLQQLNQYRDFATRLKSTFLYGRYPGVLFFDVYWNNNTTVAEENKPYWILDMSDYITENKLSSVFVEEDTKKKQSKRRNENDHKISVQLKNVFSLDIDLLEKDIPNIKEQYNSVCDIIESIKYTPKEIKEDNQDADKQERKISLHFFKMFGTYKKSETVASDEQEKGKNKIWTFDGMPLDLFDASENSVFPLVSPEISKYQKMISEFIYKLKCYASGNLLENYGKYDYAFNKCFKWYRLFPQWIERTYHGHWNTDLEAFLEKKDPIFQFKKAQCSHRKNENLFSLLLLELLKLKLYNDVRTTEYIIGNSEIKMAPLDKLAASYYDQYKFVLKREVKTTVDNLCLVGRRLGGNVIDEEEIRSILYRNPAEWMISYDTILDHIKKGSSKKFTVLKKFFRKFDEEKFVFDTLESDNLYKYAKYAKRLMQIFIHPWTKNVPLFQFIALMQCCVDCKESSLTIQHYGMNRGKKTVTLGAIMRNPTKNMFKEVRLFLVYLVQRRMHLNELSSQSLYEINENDLSPLLKKIDEYDLAQRKMVLENIEKIDCWEDVFLNFTEYSEVSPVSLSGGAVRISHNAN